MKSADGARFVFIVKVVVIMFSVRVVTIPVFRGILECFVRNCVLLDECVVENWDVENKLLQHGEVRERDIREADRWTGCGGN